MEKRTRIKSWFSNLKDTFVITSGYDPNYNCFAFSVHDTENWWEYDATHENEPTYWPLGLEDSDTVKGFIEALRHKGFEEIDNCDLVSCSLNNMNNWSAPDVSAIREEQHGAGTAESKVGGGAERAAGARTLDSTAQDRTGTGLARADHTALCQGSE